ncbi:MULTISPECIES: signal peptidase I [Streptococcus]|uniref:Signal peptidase I n=1 Tax=Streptococcus equinus TaxID=1335 RepID=A0A1G9LNS5_STREI|nr:MULTISPECIES: signal peptidase I [Streptococcus]KEY47135.1 signal peptidase [Streptococcus equinus]KFN86818.1 signal peptidase [Streptococcus equinus ATCC 33317]MDO4886504.1 signal peptidase I [Streptococcus sp.]QGX46054.1 signal peptidase I [Streptococcus equinus]QMS96275.1 signal peptidase I [Streptococcus equinus]
MKPLFEKKSQKINLTDLPKADDLSKELGKIKYRERYVRTLRSTVFTLVTVAALAVLIATIWLPVLQIYGNSMTPTLKAGDMVVSVSKKNLKQGDVVAFYYNNKVLVKRVIATSGQWVNVDKKGNVTVDGKKLNEPYLQKGEKDYGETNIKLPYQVPDGKYFVMGDHRKVSIDSRNKTVGPVDSEQLVGKLTLRIWPLSRMGAID